jgi:hypothetical protein
METDAKLYAILKEKMARFVVTLDKLQEVAHPMDTNICINSIGVLPFYTKLLRKLGIAMTDNVHHYLECKETARMRKIECGKM